MAFWVYILKCANGSYYTGHTEDLERRMAEHQTGTPVCYTTTRRPIALVFSQACASRAEALASERQIKGWSRAKKTALIAGDWDQLKMLARTSTPHTPDSE
ncbi:MAG: GIY-YIG nuclease family protein [Alphaproteobacteria bacterium]|nr:MAG: GIY-YIG nuclease family protein [Alphaproteobacteria bacterium]